MCVCERVVCVCFVYVNVTTYEHKYVNTVQKSFFTRIRKLVQL